MADKSLELGYDYKINVRSYACTDSSWYPDSWLSDSQYISSSIINNLTGSALFHMPYMGVPAQWQFFQFYVNSLTSVALSVGELQIVGDITLTGVDVDYLIIYSGDVTDVDVMRNPVAVRPVSLVSGNTYSLDEMIKTTAEEFRGDISVVFCCSTNSGNDVGISWSGLHLQKYDENEDSGSLNILRYIKNIWNGIKSLPSNIANNISGFFASLENKVTSVVNGFQSWLSDAFRIPDREYMDGVKDRINKQLRQSLGCVYEVVDWISSVFQSLLSPTPNGNIAVPHIEVMGLTIFDDTTITVIPAGMEYIHTLCQLVTSMVLVLLIVNYLRKQPTIIVGMFADVRTANEEVQK